MQRKNYSLYYLISVFFVLFALLFSVHFWSFNESFYRKEHDNILLYGKHLSEYIGISDEKLAELTSFTLDYLNDPGASLDISMEVHGKMREVFTDDEKLHMVDVRRLNLAANYLCVISFIIVCAGIICMIIRKMSFDGLHAAYGRVLKILMMFITVLAIWIAIDFDSFWNSFHHVFFASNDLWILDLRKDILIMIVPPEFFNHLVIYIVMTFVAIVIMVYFLLGLAKRKA